MHKPLFKSICAFMLLAAVIFFPASSSFADFKASPWTKEKLYADKISRKAGFGLLNLSVGWTALLFEPYHEGWKGFGTGLLYSVTNTAGGILHTATFPIPLDIPLPEGGIAHDYER